MGAALAAVTACSVTGGVMFQRFAELREPIWLIAGFVAYNFSNIGWVLLIDQTGLARAATLSSAVTILALTLIGFALGERVKVATWMAVVLVVAAMFVSSTGSQVADVTQQSTEAEQSRQTAKRGGSSR